MKILLNLTTATALLLVASTAWTHSAEKHMKNAEKADCSAMEGMDMSEMDKDDPVMKAMMKKCMKQMHDKHPMEGKEKHKKKPGSEDHGGPTDN